MRGVFGLVGLLIGVGLLVWIYSIVAIPTAKQGKEVQKEVQQISGRGEDGMSASDSFATEAQFKGGAVESLLVTNLVGGGPMQTQFGLAAGDRITAVNGMALSGLASDEELARGLVAEAYGKKQTLTVRRGDQTLTLPASAAPTPAPVAVDSANPSANPSATPPPQPAPAPQKSRGIAGQIEDIQNAAGGTGKQE